MFLFKEEMAGLRLGDLENIIRFHEMVPALFPADLPALRFTHPVDRNVGIGAVQIVLDRVRGMGRRK